MAKLISEMGCLRTPKVFRLAAQGWTSLSEYYPGFRQEMILRKDLSAPRAVRCQQRGSSMPQTDSLRARSQQRYWLQTDPACSSLRALSMKYVYWLDPGEHSLRLGTPGLNDATPSALAEVWPPIHALMGFGDASSPGGAL